MASINSYLHFNDNCREAMNFYKDSLGGELYFQTVKESPMASQVPPHLQENIMHSTLTNGDMIIMASDMHRGKLLEGNTISLAINCTSEEEIRRYYSKLSEAGTIIDPLMDAPWGAIFGAVTDKYGKNWLFNFNKNNG
jgi:PhnB protein